MSNPSDLPDFDPWTSSLEDAQQLQAQWEGSRGGPLFQWAGARDVLALQAKVEGGDGCAVLSAVAQCALWDLVMPDWLARAYLRRWRLVNDGEVATWEEAFGRPWPKGTKQAHLARYRQRRFAKYKVFNLVTDFAMQHPDKPLEPEWDRIAREAGVGKTVAQGLYYRYVAEHGMSHGEVRASLGWPRVPKKSKKLTGRQRR